MEEVVGDATAPDDNTVGAATAPESNLVGADGETAQQLLQTSSTDAKEPSVVLNVKETVDAGEYLLLLFTKTLIRFLEAVQVVTEDLGMYSNA